MRERGLFKRALNKEVERRADVVGIFTNEPAILRFIGVVLLEQNGEWQSQYRYMHINAMAELAPITAEQFTPA